MGKFIKKLFGASSMVEVARKIIAVIVIVIGCIPILNSMFSSRVEAIVQQEIAPFAAYIYGDMIKLINKNFDKIIKDPGDVKLIDIEACLQYWETLKTADIENKAILQEKIDKMKAWYIDEMEGKNGNG